MTTATTDPIESAKRLKADRKAEALRTYRQIVRGESDRADAAERLADAMELLELSNADLDADRDAWREYRRHRASLASSTADIAAAEEAHRETESRVMARLREQICGVVNGLPLDELLRMAGLFYHGTGFVREANAALVETKDVASHLRRSDMESSAQLPAIRRAHPRVFE